MTDNKFDVLDFFIELEGGKLSDQRVAAGLQWLLDHNYLSAHRFCMGTVRRSYPHLTTNTITKEDNDG